MGGTIAMIVRKPKGCDPEVQPMLRWTNPLPYHLSTPAFISGDFDRWWPEFSEQWEIMRSDYEANKSTKNFAENMTSCYFPWEDKAPAGYGLVVVDFQTKTVLHSQGYCSFGSEALYRWADMDPEEVANLRRKHQAGYIPQLVIDCLDRSKPRGEQILEVPIRVQELGMKCLDKMIELSLNAYSPSSPNTLREACKFLGVDVPEGFNPNLETRAHMWEMPYASDWKFERFDETAPGFAQLRQRAEQIGLTFTPEDDKAWHQWILAKLELEDVEDFNPQELADYRKEIEADIEASLGLLGWPESADDFKPQAPQKGLRP